VAPSPSKIQVPTVQEPLAKNGAATELHCLGHGKASSFSASAVAPVGDRGYQIFAGRQRVGVGQQNLDRVREDRGRHRSRIGTAVDRRGHRSIRGALVGTCTQRGGAHYRAELFAGTVEGVGEDPTRD
jgi:hypothetical protein